MIQLRPGNNRLPFRGLVSLSNSFDLPPVFSILPKDEIVHLARIQLHQDEIIGWIRRVLRGRYGLVPSRETREAVGIAIEEGSPPTVPQARPHLQPAFRPRAWRRKSSHLSVHRHPI
eukprot:TRINITY_DN64305_c0_g1_i1.p1 TRINITY_DN64305_c0_g1~~TRINITY_DN64305_c0_g1_i1.p1  ORF type:complete len:117 (-),score=3.12 TRINITY_DN64305_c0_g1_i1:334-684(-)